MDTLNQTKLIADVVADDNAYLDLTTEYAERKVVTIRDLKARLFEIESQIEGTIQSLEALNSVLRAHGRDSVGEEVLASKDENRGSGFATPGNRSADMPDRQPQYRTASMGDAVEEILTIAGGRIHINEITKKVFVINAKSEMTRAKRSLNSTLSAGVKDGRWMRLGGGNYQMNENGRVADNDHAR